MEAPESPNPPTAPEPRSSFRPSRLTSGIVAGGAAFAMVLAGLGIASAQTDDGSTTTAPPAASAEDGSGDGARPHRHRHHHLRPRLTVAATTLGISMEDLRAQLEEGKSLATIAGDKTDELIDALVADATTHLDDAVTHGRLTQAEADEKKATLEERMTAFVNATPPAGGERRGPGPGDAGRGHGPKASLSVAATTLGISEDELRTQLRSGKSLAEIAGDKTQALIDALVADANARIDQAVTDGKLTAEQAAERKANVAERITTMVNSTPPAPGEGGRRGHRHGPGPADGDAETETAPASVDA